MTKYGELTNYLDANSTKLDRYKDNIANFLFYFAIGMQQYFDIPFDKIMVSNKDDLNITSLGKLRRESKKFEYQTFWANNPPYIGVNIEILISIGIPSFDQSGSDISIKKMYSFKHTFLAKTLNAHYVLRIDDNDKELLIRSLEDEDTRNIYEEIFQNQANIYKHNFSNFLNGSEPPLLLN